MKGLQHQLAGAVALILLWSPHISWGSAPVRAAEQERAWVAQGFLSERLWLWQKRLNLQDWDISLRLVRATELKPKTLGNVHWDLNLHSATIAVLAPADYKLPYPELLQDMEFTIVHELIHLQLASLPRSEASRRAEEHAVNRIADALLKLDRDTAATRR
jgi:hypothetical protein